MNKVVIVGAGGIGKATALIIMNDAQFDADIYLGDISERALSHSLEWIAKGEVDMSRIHTFLMPEEGINPDMTTIFQNAAIVLDCLPGSQAPRIAAYAKEYRLHYVNLTEYVKETEQIIALSKDAETGFLLQTGLAPGYINILGHYLFQKFCDKFGVEKAKLLSMKVGALTHHALPPHFYGFTWSPIGVATEYVKDAIVLRDGKIEKIAALSGIKSNMIDGVWYESNYTSGGAADLPSALQGKVENLHYKTLRYPGHYQWVKDILNSAPYSVDRIEYLNDFMLKNIPSYEDDVVIIFAEVQGNDKRGHLQAMNKSLRVEPTFIGKQKLKAIQSTTASAMVESAWFMLQNNPRGTYLQSQVNTHEYLSGRFVQKYYGTIIE